MELKDTIAMMTSDDYRERFKAEYYQLKIRAKELEAMLEKYKTNELSFESESLYKMLVIQSALMKGYLIALKARATLDDIDLGEE